MSIIPPRIVIEATLKVGAVYKFDAPEFITTSVPHYFIIVGIESENNYMAVCTTQLEAKLKHFKNMGYHEATLAYVSPNHHNGLTDKTYVNCNEYHYISKNDLITKVQSKKFEIKGNLSKDEFKSIKDAIVLSKVNDLPEFLLRHPDE